METEKASRKRGREIFEAYEELEKGTPQYLRERLDLLALDLLRYDPDTKNEEEFIYYVFKLYKTLSEVIQAGLSRFGTSDYRLLRSCIGNRIKALKKVRSFRQHRSKDGKMTQDPYETYNIKCGGGKWTISTLCFMCVCCMVVITHRLTGRKRRMSDETYKRSIVWARKNGTILFPKRDIQKQRFTDLHLQMLHLASAWKFIPPCEEAFCFVMIMEDRMSEVVTRIDTDRLFNCPESEWVMAINRKENLYACSYDFIDDMSCIFQEFDRSYLLYEWLTAKTEQAAIPVDGMRPYAEKFKRWIGDYRDDTVTADFLGKVRQDVLYWLMRAGEQLMAKRRNNGTPLKNLKWALYNNRPYDVVNYWLNDSLYGKTNKPLECQPYEWIWDFLKVTKFRGFMGSLGLDLYESIYIREHSILKDKEKLFLHNNVNVVEVMGGRYIVWNMKMFKTSDLEECFLLWCFLTEREMGAVYQDKDGGRKNLINLKNMMRQWMSVEKMEDDSEQGSMQGDVWCL